MQIQREAPGRGTFSRRERRAPREPFSVNALKAVTKQFMGRLSFPHKNDYSGAAAAKVRDSVFSAALLKH